MATIQLSPATSTLVESLMKRHGFENADELVVVALESLDVTQAEYYEDIDPAVRASIERGEAQSKAGEGMSVEEVRERLLKRYSPPTG
jgi:predicted transcriptional regulator